MIGSSPSPHSPLIRLLSSLDLPYFVLCFGPLSLPFEGVQQTTAFCRYLLSYYSTYPLSFVQERKKNGKHTQRRNPPFTLFRGSHISTPCLKCKCILPRSTRRATMDYKAYGRVMHHTLQYYPGCTTSLNFSLGFLIQLRLQKGCFYHSYVFLVPL